MRHTYGKTLYTHAIKQLHTHYLEKKISDVWDGCAENVITHIYIN